MNDLLPYLLLTVALVIVAVVAGRALRQRRIKPASAPPAWVSRKPEHFLPGEEYCELRADFNYTNDTPATSRVTLYTFNGANRGRAVLADRMTEPDFNQQRDALKREGWREEHSSADKEGQSYFYRRSAP
ncbi:MAG: hypothetical protein IT320_21480 [Anaerolineae bacterium]|nr:hypothetical protein [Anaerolineae bacterium]